jgi:quinoprotein glucose dehydrogenase
MVVVPTGAPSPDYYGGERLGQNLYANSVVALRAGTGAVIWSFQAVHHDLWDYDLASPPALVDVEREGKKRAAVIQATKSGQLFVLDRDTGKPLFPVEERPVPKSTAAGEQSWPTQPFNTVLPALSPLRMSVDEAWGINEEERAACREQIKQLRNEGPFTPPSLEGSLLLPSNIGGAHWGGVAFDPIRQFVIVPVNRLAAFAKLIPRKQATIEKAGNRIEAEYAPMHGTPYVLKRGMVLSPHKVPCVKPPWGALVAIDLRSGKKVWEVPTGAPRLRAGPSGQPLGDAAPAGTLTLGGPIATAGGLVFMAATMFDDHLRAFDIDTGKLLWEAALPAGGKATPMTFSAGGRQYVAVTAGGDGDNFTRGDWLVAFALEEEK